MIRNNSEFLNIALKSYDNPILTSLNDFESDVKRIVHLSNMIDKFCASNDLTKLRIALNHMVIIYNCFGAASVDMIRYKIKENKFVVETMMYFLKMIPNTLPSAGIDFKLLNSLELL